MGKEALKRLSVELLKERFEGELEYSAELAHQLLHDDLRDKLGKPLYRRFVDRVLVSRKGKHQRWENRVIRVRVSVPLSERRAMIESIWDRVGFVRRSEVAIDSAIPFEKLPVLQLVGFSKPETTKPAEPEGNGHSNGHASNGGERAH